MEEEKGERRVFTVGLDRVEREMLSYMAGQEHRLAGQMLRVLIHEGAKARGLKPEMFEPQHEQVPA